MWRAKESIVNYSVAKRDLGILPTVPICSNGWFKLLKEPLSKLSSEEIPLKYDAVKVWLNKVQYQGSLFTVLLKGCNNDSKAPRQNQWYQDKILELYIMSLCEISATYKNL